MAEAGSKPQRGAGRLRWLALAGALALSACQSGPRIIPEPVGPPPEAAPVPTPAPPPVAAELPREDSERHRVALLVPLSGSNSGVGESLSHATQLAILDTKTEDVRITTYDTAPGAAAAAQRAIADGNRLILGPLLAEDVRAVAPIARAADVPVISFSNDSNVAGNGAYIMGFLPSQSIARVVNYARRTGITEFAGLMPTGLYGERASQTFLRAVRDAGGEVTDLENYDRSRESIANAVGRLDGSPFGAVLIGDSSSIGEVAVPILRRTGEGASARVLGTELWNADTGIGSKTALHGAWFASVSDQTYRQYASRYRARFGTSPYRLSSLGYDAVLLTVRIAANWEVGDDFPESRLHDSFVGVDGAFRFGRDGVAERALEVQEVRPSGTVVISPAPTGFD